MKCPISGNNIIQLPSDEETNPSSSSSPLGLAPKCDDFDMVVVVAAVGHFVSRDIFTFDFSPTTEELFCDVLTPPVVSSIPPKSS